MENGKKKAKTNINILIFCMQYNWSSFRCIYKIKTQAQGGAEKSITEIFVREKKKKTNKGNDNHKVFESLIHSTTCHTLALY